MIRIAITVDKKGLKKRRSAAVLSEPTREKLRLSKDKVKKTWRVFKQNRLGMAGLIILIVFFMMAVFASQIMWILAFIADWEYPYGPFDQVDEEFGGGAPSSEHWLGTDFRGSDILSRLIYGSRVSLIVGLVATVVSMGLGTIIGLLSGYWGGLKDEVLMRITDVFLVLPWLVLMIALAAVLPGGPTVGKVVFVIGITGWSATTRMVRAQVLSIKERAFVERARAIGSSDAHIVARHVFPNVFPIVFANAILTIALSILSESTLSFIGLGPDPTKVVTWGNMLEDAVKGGAMYNELYLWIFAPGLCIVFVVLGFTFVGYALDEIFNPKLRKR
ncbi:MAG: ABC transporter permease [Methanobacteriota archaeon]|nr:MAG: ABC transporter permease [Euryarchaeota archaeon]